MTNTAILDMNFWFHKGAKESPEVYAMMTTSSDGSYGFVMWDEWSEDDFLPNLFTPFSIFKLLFKDAVMLPEWVYNFSHEDIFVTISDSNGNVIDTEISLDHETGDIVVTTLNPFSGSLLVVGKNFEQALPQFFVKDIESWESDDNGYYISIPQTEHNFIGVNVIESIRSSEGNIVDVNMLTNEDFDVIIRSNISFDGRISLLGDVNQPNLFVKEYFEEDWISVDDETWEVVLTPEEHLLVSPVQDLLIRTKGENNVSIDTGIHINEESGVISFLSHYPLYIKVIIFDEKNFYQSTLHDDIWISDEEPYKIVIPYKVHGLFNVPTKINHHIKEISLSETKYLPTQLQILLDTYYNINGLWLVVEDDEDVYASILIDVDQEFPLLDLLAKTKDFIYGGEAINYGNPDDSRESFLETYYNHYEELTPLMKSMVMEMYYLHYNENDDFQLLKYVIDQMPSYTNVEENKSYYLMTTLYSYMVINKILKRKITDNESFEYTPDYWDNK